MPRAVLDSSVLVSAFLTPRGSVVRLLREPARSQYQLCLSEYILTETAETLLSKTRLRTYAYADTDMYDFHALAADPCGDDRQFAHASRGPQRSEGRSDHSDRCRDKSR